MRGFPNTIFVTIHKVTLNLPKCSDARPQMNVGCKGVNIYNLQKGSG